MVKNNSLKNSNWQWNSAERHFFKKLKSPAQIQEFLDGVTYSDDEWYRSPRQVIAEQRAHCFDGALFAAAALRQLGHRPILLDLRAVRDDDHVLALFKRSSKWGAIAKSNFVGLRFREPIFRTLRELTLSYFETYYNVDGEKTLRSFSRPLILEQFDNLGWMFADDNLSLIAARLDDLPHTPIITPAEIRALCRVDQRSYQAGMLGVNRAGLYIPEKKKS